MLLLTGRAVGFSVFPSVGVAAFSAGLAAIGIGLAAEGAGESLAAAAEAMVTAAGTVPASGRPRRSGPGPVADSNGDSSSQRLPAAAGGGA